MKYVIASDFDNTLSDGDVGKNLFFLLGKSEEEFEQIVEKIREKNLYQRGAELSSIILTYGEKKITKKMLKEAGRKTRIKPGLEKMLEIIKSGKVVDKKTNVIPDIEFYVVSAAPQVSIVEAIGSLVPSKNIYGTLFEYDEEEKVVGVKKVCAGDGKKEAIEKIVKKERIQLSNIIYIGDGDSDLVVMRYLKHKYGYVVSVGKSKDVGDIANKTVVSNRVTGILVPILKDIFAYSDKDIMFLFDQFGEKIFNWQVEEIHQLYIESE